MRDAVTRESQDALVLDPWRNALENVAEELRTEGRRETLLELLEAKFGSVDLSVRIRIAKASIEQLDDWARQVVLDQTVEEPSRGDSWVSAADQLRAEGRREILLATLVSRFRSVSPTLRARLGRASIQQLKVWTRRVVRVGTIEEVFAD